MWTKEIEELFTSINLLQQRLYIMRAKKVHMPNYLEAVLFFFPFCTMKVQLKSVHFKKPLTRSSFLSKSVVIFAEIKTKSVKMTTLFERNEDRVTGFLKWTVFNPFKKKKRNWQKVLKKVQSYLEFGLKNPVVTGSVHTAKHQHSELCLPVNSIFVVFIYLTV